MAGAASLGPIRVREERGWTNPQDSRPIRKPNANRLPEKQLEAKVQSDNVHQVLISNSYSSVGAVRWIMLRGEDRKHDRLGRVLNSGELSLPTSELGTGRSFLPVDGGPKGLSVFPEDYLPVVFLTAALIR
jgi:hypothetical protein